MFLSRLCLDCLRFFPITLAVARKAASSQGGALALTPLDGAYWRLLR